MFTKNTCYKSKCSYDNEITHSNSRNKKVLNRRV